MKQVVMSFSPVPCYVEAQKPGPFDCQELGFKWLDWVAEFSGESICNYELVLLVRPQAQLPDSISAWGKVLRFSENSFVVAYPFGPNLVFRQVLWLQVHNKIQGPFLWCEPDCIPVKSNWLDLIAAEYKHCAKPFMGNIVEPIYDKNIGARVPRHMTGNAVYPDKAYKEAPKLMEANQTPWDVLAAEQILPKCHQTDLFQHEFRSPQIVSLEQLNRIVKPNTALFHTDKFGSIIQLLGYGDPVSLEQAEPEPAPETSVARDQMLEEIISQCRIDTEFGKKVAYQMIEHKVVNAGHIANYARNKRKTEQLSDEEFKSRIKKKDVAVASTTC